MFTTERGRRKGALAWQDHCVDTLLAKECPANFKHNLKSPAIFDSSELKNCKGFARGRWLRDGTSRKYDESVFPSRVQNVLKKLSPIISVGNSFEHVGALRMIDEDDI